MEAGGHEEVGRMWRQLQVVLKPRQGCRGKRYLELHLLGPLGAAQGPGGSGPDVEGGQEAAWPGTGWNQNQVERNHP